MPARTNEFQHLVKLIHQAMAPAGAKVTESAMVSAPGFGQLREIDVLIESEVNPYRIKVAVEAKDHQRKLNVTDIEAIIGKYRSAASVIVDKVVIVSRRGFAKHAVEKANAVGIELLTLNEISEEDLQNISSGRIAPTQGQTMDFRMGPVIANLELVPPPAEVNPKDAFERGHLVCQCCKKDHGTPLAYVNHYAFKRLMADPSILKKFNDELDKHPRVCLKAELPANKLRLVIDGHEYSLERIKFHVHATHEKVPLRFKAYEIKGETIGSKVVQRAMAEFSTHSFEMVFPDGLHSKRIAIDISAKCK